MRISFSLIFKDSINFMRNHFRVILTTLLFFPLLGLGLDWLLTPDIQKLIPFIKNYPNPYGDYLMKATVLIINDMPLHHRLFASNALSPYMQNYMIICIIQLIVAPLFCLALIAQLATDSRWNVKDLVTSMLKAILFMLFFSVIPSLWFIITLFLVIKVIPSLYFVFLIGLLFFFTLFCILMGPLILVYSVQHPISTLFRSIPVTFKFLKNQYKIIIPLFILSLLTKILSLTCGFLEMHYPVIPLWLFSLIQGMVDLTFVFFFFTCFYRLYALTKHSLKPVLPAMRTQTNFEQE